MKILVINELYPPYYIGGYELICQQVVEGLEKMGCEVWVLTTSYGVSSRVVEGNIYRQLNYLLDDYKNLLHRRLLQITQFYRTYQNYRITRDLILKTQPDIIFAWNLQFTSLMPAFAAQELGYPLVFEFGGHWLAQEKIEWNDLNWIQKLFRRLVMGLRKQDDLHIQGAVFVTEKLMHFYQKCKIQIDEPLVIPNSLPDEWIIDELPNQRDGAVFRLLYVGRFSDDKGTATTIDVLHTLVNELSHNNVQFDLFGFGDTDYLRMLQEKIERYHLKKYVRFYDFTPREELLKKMRSYDALLFSTPQWEGFGLAIIEAMSQGVIAVASDIDGPNEIIEHEKNGLLVPPGDALAMAKAVESLILSPSKAQALRKNALKKVHEEYSNSKMVSRYSTFLFSMKKG